MSPCVVCQDLDPVYCRQASGSDLSSSATRNLHPGKTVGVFYSGDFKNLVFSASDIGSPRCPPCRLILEGIMYNCDLIDLEKSTKPEYASALLMYQSTFSKTLRCSLVIWKIPSKLTESNSWFWQEGYAKYIVDITLEFYVLPGCESIWKAVQPSHHWNSNDISLAVKDLPALIDKCSEIHQECDQSTVPELPSRVIDVGVVDTPSNPKLYETNQETGRYLCLSHCWGGSLPICTTSASLEGYKKEIPWASLPKTFQDAIDLTKCLKFRYLWIDSLCIIQDNSSDWEREAAAMANIYGNFFLTIATTAATNSAGGLYHRPQIRLHVLKSPGADGIETTVYVRRIIDHKPFSTLGAFLNEGEAEATQYPLLTRSWCFQEHLLSRRVVQFGPHELIWECNRNLGCPCGELNAGFSQKVIFQEHFRASLSGKFDEETTRELTHRGWNQVVVSPYTSKGLTLPSDRLVALSGIAKVIMATYGSKYLASLWEMDLVNGFCWYRQCTDRRPPTRPLEYLAPTWSWASVNTHVRWSHWYIKPTEVDVEIVKAESIPKTIDPTGAVEDGSVTISGPMTRGRYFSKNVRSIKRYFIEVNGLEQSFIPDIEIDRYPEMEGKWQPVFLLRLSHAKTIKHGIPDQLFSNTRALVLRELPFNFERVSYLETYDAEVVDWFTNIGHATVKIR